MFWDKWGGGQSDQMLLANQFLHIISMFHKPVLYYEIYL